MGSDEKVVVGIIVAAIVVWIIGYWFWQDPIWPFTVILNLLGDMGIGYGTSGGYPWESSTSGSVPYSR